MKKSAFKTMVSLILALFLICGISFAQETMPMDKTQMDKTPMDKMQMPGKMDHSKHMGTMINESVVDGYKLAFHILELPGKKELHLMVYINTTENKPVTDAKVGYLVKGPDGKTQKVMAMAMKSAYGGDVDFTKKGKYTIKMKAAVGKKKIMNTLEYETK